MERFDWAWDNLATRTPGDLQSKGIDVYVAPNIPLGTKVVDLADGAVRFFRAERQRPTDGCFADFGSLERFCLKTGFPLAEVNGQVSVLPVGGQQAGDPLRHAGR
jgi:hypothetical protein